MNFDWSDRSGREELGREMSGIGMLALAFKRLIVDGGGSDESEEVSTVWNGTYCPFWIHFGGVDGRLRNG